MEVPVSTAPTLSVGQAISYGWRRSWSNFWRLLLVVIVFAVLNGAASFIGFGGSFPTIDTSDPSAAADALNQLFSWQNTVLGLVSFVAQIFVSIFISLGIIRIAVAVTAGEDVNVGQAFALRGFGRFLGGSIIVGIVITLGFVIPFAPLLGVSIATDSAVWGVIGAVIGVILVIVINLCFSMFGFVIIDKDAPGLSGLGESWRIVRPRFFPLLGLHILLALIGIGLFIAAIVLGVLMILVGLLVTIPLATVIIFGLYALSIGSAYRQLTGEPVA
jgi:hypothetical protein